MSRSRGEQIGGEISRSLMRGRWAGCNSFGARLHFGAQEHAAQSDATDSAPGKKKSQSIESTCMGNCVAEAEEMSRGLEGVALGVGCSLIAGPVINYREQLAAEGN